MHITTVKKLSIKHDGLTEKAIRVHIARRKVNGLEESGALFRRGKRVYIIEEKYLAWLSGRPVEDFYPTSIHVE